MESVRYALNRAHAATGSAAEAWLDRALRLAPDVPTVAFVVAQRLALINPARALGMMRTLWSDHPTFREAGLAVVAGEFRAGRVATAAACLGRLLSAHMPAFDSMFGALADSICRAAGEAGWIMADSTGTIRYSAQRAIRLTLDGAPVGCTRKSAIGGWPLPARWREAALLAARCGDRPLLGSPIHLARRRRAEGFVAMTAEGGVSGWAWLPEDADHPVPLSLVLNGVARPIAAVEEDVPAPPANLLDRRRRIAVPASEVLGIAEIRVIGPDGRDLVGSPLYPAREREAARDAAARLALLHGTRPTRHRKPDACDRWRPLAMTLLAPPAAKAAAPVVAVARAVDVLIPVWRGAAELASCLASLQTSLPPRCRIVVVDDASPDDELRDLLAHHAAKRQITVLRHAVNKGFPAAANTGLRRAARGGRDVLLLNSDTLLPPAAIQRLAAVAASAEDIGSVTPMSNDGSIVSYAPAVGIADHDAVAAFDTAFAHTHGAQSVDIPTGVGFCMYIRHDCLIGTGLFREHIFGQGYGEENDWCLRARHLGWRHVAATGVFVGHIGGRSFGALKADLLARNVAILNRLHPGYDAAMAEFTARDPLAGPRRSIDAERWERGRSKLGAVVLITHGRHGGVGRFVQDRMALLRAQGLRPIKLSPPVDATRKGMIALADDGLEGTPDLLFDAHDGLDSLAELLKGDGVQSVEWHHFLGHGLDVVALASRLGVGFEMFVHDSALWCPRVTLSDTAGRYCGEPAEPAACEACVRDHGSRLDEEIAVSDLRARSQGWLRHARRVVVACEDAEWRVVRQFPTIQPVVMPWEDDALMLDAAAVMPHRPLLDGGASADAPGNTEPLRIVTVGAIGPEKGYQVLLDGARDAVRRGLPLEFVVVGYTIDDARLLETGRVFITGRFMEAEAAALVAAQRGDFGFIPSLWPETWCYALSALWRGSLPVAAFALGAQAERVARANVRAGAAIVSPGAAPAPALGSSLTPTGAGAVLPLGLPAPKLNDLLLSLAAGRRRQREGALVHAKH